MTVGAIPRRAGPTPGNGVAIVFPFAFKVFLATDLLVQLTVLATGVITTLVKDAASGYSVALNVDQNANPGGSITYNPLGVPMPAGFTLTITSAMPETQGTHLINGGNFLANNVEDMADRDMIATQDLAVKVAGSLQFPLVDGALNPVLPAAAQRAGLFLAFDGAGNLIASAGGGTVAISAAMTPVVQAATLALGRTAMGVAASGVNVDVTNLNGVGAAGVALGAGSVAITQAGNDSSTKIATTAQVQAALALKGNGTCDFRLTLTTAVPVTTADVVGAGTLYCSPYKGNRISLYDGVSVWNTRISAEFSLALNALTVALPYDVFCYDNAGTPTLEFLAWASTTARATALVPQDGVLVKTGATTRRYLGTFATTGAATTEDSKTNRYLWNYYNRVRKFAQAVDATASWTYTTAAWRQARASTANQLNMVVGVSEDAVHATVGSTFINTNISIDADVGIGVNSTTVNSAQIFQQGQTPQANGRANTGASWWGFLAIGMNFLAWLEQSGAAGTTTFYGTTTTSITVQSGMLGEIPC